jgi:hypothetical protein
VAAPFSKRIFFATLVAASYTPSAGLFPPAGYDWVIRDIEARATGGAGVEMLMRVYPTNEVLITIPIPANSNSNQWQGRVVIPDGAGVRFYCTIAATVVVSGYQLSAS